MYSKDDSARSSLLTKTAIFTSIATAMLLVGCGGSAPNTVTILNTDRNITVNDSWLVTIPQRGKDALEAVFESSDFMEEQERVTAHVRDAIELKHPENFQNSLPIQTQSDSATSLVSAWDAYRQNAVVFSNRL